MVWPLQLLLGWLQDSWQVRGMKEESGNEGAEPRLMQNHAKVATAAPTAHSIRSEPHKQVII
ncbi:Hypothetical protein P9303_07301 [Prochlorococcus marinus str. MIT 9303]|uniref:Uncharacterized protein n=1 Tax=Prochlorococcus marinus (strain MIT 9303) TaxID=59922 RepID=A2C7M1_PROM3|nr:Hypothetical protein P9303_07301 [Prochlorococcus marinus str. MIT 9303]